MNNNIDKLKDAFYLVDEIANLERHEIENYFSNEQIENIHILLKELLGRETFPKTMSPSEFADLIYELRKTRKEWGRKLGDTITMSADIIDKGDIEAGINALDEFIKMCPSPYYRRHAQNQIRYYEKEGKLKKR